VGRGREKRYAKLVFADPENRRSPWVVPGILIIVCLLGLAFAFLDAGQRGEASVVAPSVSGPSQASVTDAEGALVREHVLLMHQSAQQEVLQTPDPAPTCGDLRVLVDRSHTLPPGYAPGDLVALPAYGVPTVGGRGLVLRREAAEHLRGLISAATADGEELVVASAFRSYVDQRSTYGRLKSIYGPGADAMSAPPGHSQHQLGTAVDFTNAIADYQVEPTFGRTTAAAWLQDHATEYGFVLAYPPGRNATKYDFEPWHYRYIGVENTLRFEQSGLVLQAFLAREQVLPDC